MEVNWINQLSLLGALQGGILATVIWRKKNTNREASFFLGLLLIFTSLALIGKVFYQTEVLSRFWLVYTLADVIIFLFGPVIYFFTHALLNESLPSKGSYKWHLAPTLLHFFLFTPLISLSIAGFITFISPNQMLQMYAFLEFFAILSLGIYSWKSINLFHKYELKHYGRFSFPVLSSFLKSFLYFFFTLSVVWLLAYMLRVTVLFNGYEMIGYYGFWTFASVLTYLLSYKLLLNPNTLDLNEGNTVLAHKKAVNPILKATNIDETQKDQLSLLMQDSKIYRNPKLSLEELAQMMELNRHELSKVINQGFGKTFFDLINSYRVKEFIDVYDNDKNLTFLEVAYEVGFNSKSAFNRAFRKEKGASPSEFFKNHLVAKK